jgi:hypothetical protein
LGTRRPIPSFLVPLLFLFVGDRLDLLGRTLLTYPSKAKPMRQWTKTAKDPARMSPKKAKSRKERAAEAVKDLVDASTVARSLLTLLADRSSTGRLRKVPVQRPRLMSMVPNIFPTSGNVHSSFSSFIKGS